MDTQGRFSANVTYLVVRSMNEKRYYSEANYNISLRLPVFDNLKDLFGNLEARLNKVGASEFLIEDCKQIGEEVQTRASHNLLVAIEFYRASEYIRTLEDMVVVSAEMLDAANSLDELGNVINWSTSLAVRALGFALEARDGTTQFSSQDPQDIEHSSNLWRATDVVSDKCANRDFVYAC